MSVPKKEYVNREGVTELVSLIKDALTDKMDSDDANISNGTITINDQSITPITQQYSLPKASSDTLGGIKVGNNLSIDLDGTLNATGGGSSITVDDHIDATSENPVQNKVIKSALDDKLDKTDATISSGEITIQEHQLVPITQNEIETLWGQSLPQQQTPVSGQSVPSLAGGPSGPSGVSTVIEEGE